MVKKVSFLSVLFFIGEGQCALSSEMKLPDALGYETQEEEIPLDEKLVSIEKMGRKIVEKYAEETDQNTPENTDETLQNFKVQDDGNLTEQPVFSCLDVLARNYNSTDVAMTALIEDVLSIYCLSEKVLQASYQKYISILNKIQNNFNKKKLIPLIKAHILLIRKNIEKIKSIIAPLLLAAQEGLILFAQGEIRDVLNTWEQKYSQETTVN